MNTSLKITAFAAVLTAVFGSAYGAGRGVGPLDAEPASAAHSDGHGDTGKGGTGHDAEGGHGGEDGGGPAAGGLRISDGGYRLQVMTPRLEAGGEQELRFAVLDRGGDPLTDYRREHGRELHLILASRDLNTYRHLHPVRAADGTWSIRAVLPRAGDYRLFADFLPDAHGATSLTLGADIAVGGDYGPGDLPEESATATVGGYTVRLDGGLSPGSPRELHLTVEKDGEPVTDLDPYLGAYGHLVALRAGDLAYLHVHPNGEPGDGSTRPGPEISFTATAPSDGTYRLFLDFKHDGEVRTAAFTVRTGPEGPGGDEGPAGPEADDGHRH